MWICPDGSVLEPRSDKNKARQRGCDLGTAGKKFLGGGPTVGWRGNVWVGIAVKVLIVS